MPRPLRSIHLNKVYRVQLDKRIRQYLGTDFLKLYQAGQFPRRAVFFNDLTGRWEPVGRLARTLEGGGSGCVGLLLLTVLLLGCAALVGWALAVRQGVSFFQ